MPKPAEGDEFVTLADGTKMKASEVPPGTKLAGGGKMPAVPPGAAVVTLADGSVVLASEVPAGTRIFARKESSCASKSTVALSVSTSRTTSPTPPHGLSMVVSQRRHWCPLVAPPPMAPPSSPPPQASGALRS